MRTSGKEWEGGGDDGNTGGGGFHLDVVQKGDLPAPLTGNQTTFAFF